MNKVIACAVGMVLSVGALAAAQPGRLQPPYKIVCTTGMVADIVRQVAGDKASVESLMGPGVDPHLYQPTREDIAKLLKADVIFYNGLMLEGKMTDALIKVQRTQPRVFAVTELIDSKLLLEPDGVEGHADPHVWMDVSLWKKCTEMVARTLSDAAQDPSNASYYQENYARYAAELDSLDAYARKALASIPASSRLVVTSHDAFGYLGRAYGVEVLGIQGISTESEAGVEDINRLVSTLVERSIKAIFVETSVSAKNVSSLIEGTRSRGHDVKIGGELFSDAMGKAGTYEGTYLGMIDHNVTAIARALGGEAPERGWKGKLSAEP